MVHLLRSLFGSNVAVGYPGQQNWMRRHCSKIVSVALSAIALVTAQAVDRRHPALATCLRLGAAGTGLFWLFRAILSLGNHHHQHQHQVPHHPPYSRYNPLYYIQQFPRYFSRFPKIKPAFSQSVHNGVIPGPMPPHQASKSVIPGPLPTGPVHSSQAGSLVTGLLPSAPMHMQPTNASKSYVAPVAPGPLPSHHNNKNWKNLSGQSKGFPQVAHTPAQSSGVNPFPGVVKSSMGHGNSVPKVAPGPMPGHSGGPVGFNSKGQAMFSASAHPNPA